MNTRKISLVFTVQPAKFYVNPVTLDNFFQARDDGHSEGEMRAISEKAIAEHKNLRSALKGANIATLCSEGPENSPDAIFPNNSFSFHECDGKVVVILYPMSKGRQDELPDQFIAFLKAIADGGLHDLRTLEEKGQYLEGTGVLNFNGPENAIYMGRSERAHEDVMNIVGDILKIDQDRRFVFDMLDAKGRRIYHTNVINWVGENVFALCSASLPDGAEKEKLIAHVHAEFEHFVDLSFGEIDAFAGNALEVDDRGGNNWLTISRSGFEGLSPANQKLISEIYGNNIIATDAYNIQKYGGGSIRCMEAEGDLSPGKVENIMEKFGQHGLKAL